MAYNIIVDYTNTEVGYVNGPITVARAKAFCRVENTTAEQDIDFALWIRAARTKIEQYCGISLIPRNIVAVLQAPQGMMELPFGPVTSTPTFVDENNTAQVIDLIGLSYKTIKNPIDYTKATYTAGYADGQVPEELQEAILLQVAYWWENRGDQDVQGWSNQVIAIVQKWKRF
jgi:uncharacterized phiE125 gp8 family phage protein